MTPGLRGRGRRGGRAAAALVEGKGTGADAGVCAGAWMSDYRPPWWLPTGHLQTAYASLLSPRRQPPFRRQRIDLDRGLVLTLDWLDAPPTAPTVALFGGVCGNAQSHYARSVMQHLAAREWAGVIVELTAAPSAWHQLPHTYFGADGSEIGSVLSALVAIRPEASWHAVGFSLGGTALLRWLNETGCRAREYVDSAATVCAPTFLPATTTNLNRGFSRVYEAYLLRSLKLRLDSGFDGVPAESIASIQRARTVRAFHSGVVSLVRGENKAVRVASRRVDLSGIAVPSLVIQARNDPVLSRDDLLQAARVPDVVVIEQPARGGHVGFVSGPFPGNLEWLPERLLSFFSAEHPARSPKG